MHSEWRHREHNVMSLVLYENGLSTRMAHSLRKTPTCEGRGGRLPSCRDSCSTRSLRPELQGQITAGSPCGADSRCVSYREEP